MLHLIFFFFFSKYKPVLYLSCCCSSSLPASSLLDSSQSSQGSHFVIREIRQKVVLVSFSKEGEEEKEEGAVDRSETAEREFLCLLFE